MSIGDQPRVDVRVSDAEREHAAELLQTHHAEGRLTLDELTERVEEVYRARSASELEHALRELPAATVEEPMSRVRRRRRPPRMLGWWLRINGICTAVWAATSVGSGVHYFWPMWVMLGTGIPVLKSMGHHQPHGQGGAETGSPVPQQPEVRVDDVASGRVVSSLLFVDIVGSTQRAAALGDTAWNAVLSRYERNVRGDVAAAGGREVFTKGDEVVAAFATPAMAVQAGRAIRADARALGLEVRIGAHAGEVDQRGQEMRGLAMHIGQRVGGAAQPGQILVSSTVRDLLAGSSVQFIDAGEHELKGVPGTWRLFAVED